MARKFKNIDQLQRNKEIEGTIGTPVGFPGGITLQVLAATDANPKWKAFGEKFSAEVRRMSRANVPDDKSRKYLAEQYALLFVIGWEGVFETDDSGNDVEVPFTHEAVVDFLMQTDDAIPGLQRVVFDTQMFRGERIEINAGAIKNS